MKGQISVYCPHCKVLEVVGASILSNGIEKKQCQNCKKFSYTKDWRKTILN